MSATSDLIVGLLIGPLTQFEKAKIKEGLQAIHDKKGVDEYKATVLSAYAPVKLLLTKVVEGTKTKLDDQIVGALIEAIEESASENGVTLPDVTATAA